MKTGFLWKLAGAAIAAAACIPAGALDLYIHHSYGELVDRGNVLVAVSSRYNLQPDCAAGISVAQAGNLLTLTLRRSSGVPLPEQCGYMTATLAPQSAGDYTVTAQIVASDGAVADSVTRPMRILPIEGRCNPEPELSPSIWGRPKGANPAAPGAFIARIAADPGFAASLGNPAVRLSPIAEDVYVDYPPLDDIPPMLDLLLRSGAFESVSRNGYACFATSPPDTIATVLEFFHSGLGQYFYTGAASEIVAIDAGKVGPWVRTGKSFRVVAEPGCRPTAVDTVVYRFHGRPGTGPGSHFFTRDRTECHAVNANARWDFEGIPFRAAPLLPDGTCAVPYMQQRVPLYRVWRPFGASTHRLTTERDIVAAMVAQGWIDEGAAMCVLPPA
jgi:hypothetical protein